VYSVATLARVMPKKTALIITDMINSYDHPDADKLVKSVEKVLPNIEKLIQRASDEEVTTIYVNDNFGAWNSSREELVEAACDGERGDLIEPIRPAKDTAFVVKARHSAFYETPLEYLLRANEIERVVLVGQTTEQCILYSALDAYIRHFEVAVPRDAVAHIHEHLADASFEMMQLNMDADISDAESVELS
jgi:nicotinamidase-related amidase